MSFLNSFNKVYKFSDENEAFDCLQELYDDARQKLLGKFAEFSASKDVQQEPASVYYPYMRIKVDNARRVDSRLSYGFVSRPGTYSTTLTRPDIFDHYYKDQMRLLLRNHGVPIEIGVSDTPMPIHFV